MQVASAPAGLGWDNPAPAAGTDPLAQPQDQSQAQSQQGQAGQPEAQAQQAQAQPEAAPPGPSFGPLRTLPLQVPSPAITSLGALDPSADAPLGPLRELPLADTGSQLRDNRMPPGQLLLGPLRTLPLRVADPRSLGSLERPNQPGAPAQPAGPGYVPPPNLLSPMPTLVLQPAPANALGELVRPGQPLPPDNSPWQGFEIGQGKPVPSVLLDFLPAAPVAIQLKQQAKSGQPEPDTPAPEGAAPAEATPPVDPAAPAEAATPTTPSADPMEVAALELMLAEPAARPAQG